MDLLAKLCPDGTTLTANLCTRQPDGRCNWGFPECPSGGQADASSAEASSVDASPALQWYTTCGYPVCRGDLDPDAGAACPKVGTPCVTRGDTCGTPSDANCGVTFVCSDRDPKTPGCPISSREFKHGISYLGQTELEALHDQTLGIRLATYQYNPEVDNPDPTHLGFILEDIPRSPAVDSARHRVDLYGYMSMVVATMQVQEKEIAELRKELAATRSTCR
jgi:hypothetical protein